VANRRSFRGSQAPRRTAFWEGALIDFSLASGTSAIAAAISEATLENVPNPTIVRVRGNVHLVATAVGGTLARANITLGLMVVDARAFAAGAGSLELPGTDLGSDWMWWDTRTLEQTSATVVDDSTGIRKDIHVDNKAMRKVGLNQLLVFFAQGVVLNSAVTTQVTASLRILIKR